MTKASDNEFPKVILDVGTIPAAPSDGNWKLYAAAGGVYAVSSNATVGPLAAGGAGGAVATDAIWDAAGDLAVGSGADTAAKLTAGAESTTLKIVSGVPAWAAFVGASYTTAAEQTITNGAAAAIVDFGTSVYDTASAVTTGASWKFTAPTTGYYMVTTHVALAGTTGWGTGERGWLQCYVDGSQAKQLERKDNYNSAGAAILMHLQGCCVVSLAATHYLDIRLAQNSGGNLNLSNEATANWIQVTKVG